MLIPRVKNLAADGKKCSLPAQLTVCVQRCFQEKLCGLIPLLMPESTAVLGDNAVITAEADDSFVSEKYALTVKDGKVHIVYGDYLGLRNAVAALAVAVTAKDGGYVVPEMQIEDQPAAEHRGVMLDLARGMKDYQILCEDMILLAKARMNIVHLHIFDSQGSCMYLESLPATALWEGCYSKQEMTDLCVLADILGLEIIPEFDMPAHSALLLEVHPEYACELPEGVVRSNWTVCTGTEAVYEMYEKVIAELASIFPGRYIHVGGDELEFIDIPGDKYICHWNVCPKCARFREKHGIVDRQDQLYYFTNRINAMVKKHGKQTIIWSDQIDCLRDVRLDRDILLHFWRIAHPGRGPYEGCSMNAQLSFGFEMVNSYYPETYLDLEPPAYNTSSATLAKWHWTAIPESEERYHSQIRGAEMCAWEYGNETGYAHYAHSLASAVVIFADKLWNGDPLPYSPEYSRSLTKTVLGARTPEGLDVFESIGDLIPPRDAVLTRKGETEKLAYPERAAVSIATMEKTLQTLEVMSGWDGAVGRRARAYARCVRYAVNELKKK